MVRTTAQAPAGPLSPPPTPIPRCLPSPSQGGSPWTLPESHRPPAPRILQEHPLSPSGTAPPPWPSAPASGDATVHITELGGRGPETAPFLEGLGTSDALPSCKVPAPAPSDPTCRTPPPPPSARGAQTREEAPAGALGAESWASPLTPNLRVRSTPGSQLGCAQRTRHPFLCRPPDPGFTGCPLGGRSLEPRVTRGKVGGSGGAEFHPRGPGGPALPSGPQAGSHPGRAAVRTSMVRSSGGGGRMVGGG